MTEYNDGLDPSSCLTWEQVTDLSQQIHDGCMFSESSVPSIIKSQAVRLYASKLRAEEEISRLKEEMSNCMEYFIGIYSHLTEKIVSLKQNLRDTSDTGHICLLKQSLGKYRIIFASLLQFNKYIDISLLENFLLSLDDNLELLIRSSSVENQETPLENQEETPLENQEETVSILLPQSFNGALSSASDHEESDNEFEDSHDFDMLNLMKNDGN